MGKDARMHGLDFTMRDLTLLKESGGVFHGYSKTDEAHAKAIFEALDINQESRILDIGCGKGVFLREAAKYPFGKIAGIEIDEKLAGRAKKNFKILGLSGRIEVCCSDALKYKNYGEFNIFYFFNPFESEIMEKVVDIIDRSQDGKKENYFMVLHHPVCAEIVEKKGGKLVKKLYDRMKSYETFIYKCGGME